MSSKLCPTIRVSFKTHAPPAHNLGTLMCRRNPPPPPTRRCRAPFASSAVAAAAAFFCLCCSLERANICASSPLLCSDISLSTPAAFDATFVTTAGNFTVHSELEWAAVGAARFYTLCRLGYYGRVGYAGDNDGSFFRYVPLFVVQWGIASNPAVAAAWEGAAIDNDAPLLSNTRGTVAFAAALILGAQEYDVSKQPPVAVNRTTQVFVNLNNSNARLDKNMFVPFGVVVGGGMGTFDKIYSGYGQLPDQDAIYARGYAYLSSSFPLLSYTTAAIAALAEVAGALSCPACNNPYMSSRVQWPALAVVAPSPPSPPASSVGGSAAHNSVQAIAVVVAIVVVMALLFLAFKLKRRSTYAQVA